MSDVERMRNLVEISRIVTGSDNFYEIKDLVISKMLSVVHPTKACVNLFYNKDYNYSHLVCSATLDYIPKLFPKNEEYGSKVDFNLYPKYIHEAVFEQKIVIVENLFEDERAKGEEQLALNENYIGRVVLPFIINNETVGFMTCYLQKEDELKEVDVDFMSQVASLMSLSISTTQKNKDINNLINKLRTSISNINKGSIMLYSAKDIFYYLKKMTSVIAETTDSDYSLITVYNRNKRGEIVGHRISTACPEEKLNELSSIMPTLLKSQKVFSSVQNSEISFPSGEKIGSYIYSRMEIDSNSEIIVLCAGNKEYSNDDENTVSVLAKQVRNSIRSYEYYVTEEKNKEIENDLSILKRQQSLIMNSSSDMEVFSDNQMYFYHRSAKLVGGDFYNAIDLGDKIVFIVADVMGHGIVSNYIVAIIKGAFEILSRYNINPSEIISQMNDYLYNEFDKMGIYSTAIVGVFDKNNLTLTISNAGHYFPIILCKDGEIVNEQEGARGIPIGIMENAVYKNTTYNLSDVKEICFFTDGILEMKNDKGEEFGINGLTEFINENSNKNKQETISNVTERINDFVNEKEKLDDILLVFIKGKDEY